jgi:hypothetical protein
MAQDEHVSAEDDRPPERVRAGVMCPEGSSLFIKWEETSRTFLTGQRINLTSQDIFEIFLFAQTDLKKLQDATSECMARIAAGSATATTTSDDGKRTNWGFAVDRDILD